MVKNPVTLNIESYQQEDSTLTLDGVQLKEFIVKVVEQLLEQKEQRARRFLVREHRTMQCS